MRRHPRLMAFIMWTVMAAISVAGFAAFEASHPEEPPTTTQGDIKDVLAIVGGVGRATVPEVTSTSALGAAAEVRASSNLPPDVERWRALVAASFPEDQVSRALEVIRCESSGDPDATHAVSGAAGLFQHLPGFWEERSAAAGRAGEDIHDPAANIAVAGFLAARDGWIHWVASVECWDR